MSYADINNLYKAQDILLFRECYAMEKIHGTSAHLFWRGGPVGFQAGGVAHDSFVALFDNVALTAGFTQLGHPSITVYGEAYGGKCQKMSKTYGPKLRFIVFEVQVGETWLNVPNAADVAAKLGLDFVHYRKVATDLPVLDAERDAPSVQAARNGMGENLPREGIVLRPLIELRKSNGERVIAKHKSEAFAERQHPPKVVDPAKWQILEDAQHIADEWVTPMRLIHVLDAIPGPHDIRQTGDVVRAMIADVLKESEGEIVVSKEARTAIGTKAAKVFHAYLAQEARKATP